eukprot:9877088-Prorocentrum_lima.AAC.1
MLATAYVGRKAGAMEKTSAMRRRATVYGMSWVVAVPVGFKSCPWWLTWFALLLPPWLYQHVAVHP